MSIYETLRDLRDTNQRQLTKKELAFVDQVETLEYMATFRPDWYPDAHKLRMISLMESKFLQQCNDGG